MEMLRKIIYSKSSENSQENILMELDLVKLQFCYLNTATLSETSPKSFYGINLEWPSSLKSEF